MKAMKRLELITALVILPLYSHAAVQGLENGLQKWLNIFTGKEANIVAIIALAIMLIGGLFNHFEWRVVAKYGGILTALMSVADIVNYIWTGNTFQ